MKMTLTPYSQAATLLTIFLVACSQIPTMVSTQTDNSMQLETKMQLETNLIHDSTPVLNRFCTRAQKIIAKTTLQSTNSIWDSLDGFIGSDALPYDGAQDEPLTTQQYLGTSAVLCKMKSWDALAFYYPGSASPGASCSDINRDTYERVLKRLRKSSVTISTIIFDEWITYTGEQWTSQSPATTSYTSTVDNRVHVVGKSLYVERTNRIPFIGPEKKGVHYCQTIAPEYLRKVITGQIKAPTCDPPPLYSPFPFKPLPTWNCPKQEVALNR